MKTVHALVLPLMQLVLAAGCGGTAADDPPKQELVRVDMAAGEYIGSTVLLIGLEEGYFADEGVDLRLLPASETGSTALPILDQNRIDVARMTNMVALVNAIDQGARVKVVVGAGHFESGKCSLSALVARRGLYADDEPVEPSSLKGKKIDYKEVSIEGYFLDRYLERGGLTLDDIEESWIPQPARMEAMNRGRIDFTVISEPWPTRMAEEGHRIVTPVGEVLDGFQWTMLAFGPRLLDDDREAGRRFVAGYLRAVRQFNEGPTPRNLELASMNTGLDIETLKKMCWPMIRADGSIEQESILEFQRWALERGHIRRIVEIEELWDPYFTTAYRDRGAEDVR
jgi:NitT/TauT family transport system substrate-binding protein